MRRSVPFPAALAALVLLALVPSVASAAVPVISHSATSAVTTTSATLNAEIDPGGKATKYHFEYGTEACSNEPDPCTALPNGPTIAATDPPQAVSATLEGLSPGATYHFRVIAKNNDGEPKGPDTPFATYGPAPAFSPCPNEALRSGVLSPPSHPAAALPDCRAYEQASPVQKNGLDPKGFVNFDKASSDGDRISFLAASPIPGGQGAQDLPLELSSRGNGSWSTQSLMPPATLAPTANILGWTPNFNQVFVTTSRFDRVGGEALFSRLSSDGSFGSILGYGQGLSTVPPSYAGASADGNEMLFESTAKLSSVPAAIQGKSNLYLWDREDEQITLAGVMNDGAAPPAGAFAGPYAWINQIPPAAETTRGGASVGSYVLDERAFSPDGKSIYFTAANTGQLYLRRNPAASQSVFVTNGAGEEECTEPGKACTIHVSASEKTIGTGEEGHDAAGPRPAAFMQAGSDGSRAILTSPEMLTNDADTGAEAKPASIALANVDGSGKNLSFKLEKANGIALDANYVYWADPEDGTIGRVELSGGHPEPEFIGKAEIEAEVEVEPGVTEGIATPEYIAVAGGHLYWTNATDGVKEDGTIGRAELSGGHAEPEFIKGASNPQGIAADSTFLYWSNAGTEEAAGIARAELEGNSVDEKFIEFGLSSLKLAPQGIAVDGTHIYVAAIEGDGSTAGNNSSYILRYDVGGGAGPTILALLNGKKVQGLALDATYLYWSQSRNDAVGRIELSNFAAKTCAEIASCRETFIPEAGNPLGVAVNGTHLYWAANQGAHLNLGNDLYRYDAIAPAGHHLTDLTPDSEPGDPFGADVLGVLGASEDLSTVYFAANGDLDGAGPARPGNCIGKVSGELNFRGECSLYVAREGHPTAFVSRLDASNDAKDWLSHGGVLGGVENTARVSASGETLLFRSAAQLTSYDNERVAEIYLYRVGRGIDCISCSPSGEAPAGEATLGSIGDTNIFPHYEPTYQLARNLSADGTRAFFESPDRLVARDTNGFGGCPEVGSLRPYLTCQDVYEWEQAGTGSCEEAVQAGGCIYLLSTGADTDGSFFLDASTSGDDAFLSTRSALVGQDGDRLADVYDARVSGGLATQNEPPPPRCEGEASCKGPVTPAAATEAPGSAGFSGPSNPRPKRPGKAGKKPHHKKHHKHAAKRPDGSRR